MREAFNIMDKLWVKSSFLACVVFTVNAADSSKFVRLDNNVNFIAGLGTIGNYNVSLFGVDFSYLNKNNNIWLGKKQLVL